MIRIVFVGPDGEARTAAADSGVRLLDVAQAAGEPLEGTCNGDMACATCHVVVAAEDFARLPPAEAGRRICSTSSPRRRGPAGSPVRSASPPRSTG